MCPGIFGYRGTLLYIPCDVISITCELGVVFRVNEISRSKPLHCSIPCILMRTFMSDWYKIRRTYRVRTFSWRLDERIIVCPVPGNDGAWWTCIPPRRWPRPGWPSAWVIRPGSAWNAGRQRIPGMPAIWRNPSSRVFCQVGVGRFGVSFSPCERRVSGRFGVGRSCWLLVIALVIA